LLTVATCASARAAAIVQPSSVAIVPNPFREAAETSRTDASDDEDLLTATLVNPAVLVTEWDEPVESPVQDESTLDASWSDEDPIIVEDDPSVTPAGLSQWLPFSPQRYGTWFVETELTMLQPHYSDDTFGTSDRSPFLGPRVQLGWESPEGFGVAGRGWGFNNSAEVERNNPSYVQVLSDTLSFSAVRLDLDLYKRFKYRSGEILVGADVSWARMTLTARRLYSVNSYSYATYYWNYVYPYYYYDGGKLISQSGSWPNYVSTFEDGGKFQVFGAGPGLRLEATHDIYRTPWSTFSLFSRGRASLLVGTFRGIDVYGITTARRDANMSLGEVALGARYTRRFHLADVSLQAAFEAQSWDMTLVDRVNLIGVTTGLGVAW
jgi:hypothetical protein